MRIHHRDEAEPFETKDTSLIREIVHPINSHAQNQSLAEATVAPSATTQAHFHTYSEEIYFVLCGEAVFRMEDECGNVEQSTLVAGAAVIIAPDRKHQIRNCGTQELRFLCCCAPPYSHDDTQLCDSLF